MDETFKVFEFFLFFLIAYHDLHNQPLKEQGISLV